MSLLIDADSEYISATGGSFGSSLTACTLAAWIKRDSGSSLYQAYGGVAPDLSVQTQGIQIAHNSTTADCFAWAGNTERRVDNAGNANSTAWQLLVFVFDQGVPLKVYTAITGGSVNSTTNTTPTETFGAFSQVRIGGSFGTTMAGWHARARIAHFSFWSRALSPTEVGYLFNGGTAGAGMNPQNATISTGLTFYMPLTADISTVAVGGVSFTATGSPSYDADNPTVDGGGASAVAPIVMKWRM